MYYFNFILFCIELFLCINVLFFIADDTQIIERCLPNMHSLGELYLPSILPYLFTLCLFAGMYIFNLLKSRYLFYFFFIRIVFLISYNLAGSQLFALLTGASYVNMSCFFCVFRRMEFFRFYTIAPIFCWVLTVIIIVLHSIISPIISILTIFKGVFFIGTVRTLGKFLYSKDLSDMFIYKIIVTFVIGLKHQVPIKTNFGDTGDSFLMSLVALGKISY
jgi:hypothetical protein